MLVGNLSHRAISKDLLLSLGERFVVLTVVPLLQERIWPRSCGCHFASLSLTTGIGLQRKGVEATELVS